MTAQEIIFTNQRTYDRMTTEQKELARLNFATQTTIFDFMGGCI